MKIVEGWGRTRQSDAPNQRVPRAPDLVSVPVSRAPALLLGATAFLAAGAAFAGGEGLDFAFDESQVDGALANFVEADSLDFTYHACVDFVQNGRFVESGYLWISSFQDADSVVPSQLNYIDNNGYTMYAVYGYPAFQVGRAQATPSGFRLNYVTVPNGAGVEPILDPNQDTQIAIMDCQVVVIGTADDVTLGDAGLLAAGEKSETNGIANGDFELIFADWQWTNSGLALFGNPAQFNVLVMNANVTELGGLLGQDHKPEGSGNLFWRQNVGVGD